MQPQRPSDRAVEGLEELLATTPYSGLEFLGRGGMGAVYVVEHRFLGRRFALKLLHRSFAGDPQFADRMRVEAQALARLEHPNVVDVVDFWVDKVGRPCVVMELLEGRTLAEELRVRKRLPVLETVGIARQALSALSAAHQIGVIHRDVKPENLFLHETLGHGRVLKVLDFGVARVLPNVSSRAPAPLSIPTATNAVVGSPRFMSPEAERGERVDSSADVFSMGLVLYAMLVGHGPFDTGAATALPPSRYAIDDASPALDAVVLRAIAPRPVDRYPDAGAFLRELKQATRAHGSQPSR